MASKGNSHIDGEISTIDARTQLRKDIPTVWSKNGGVQSGFDIGKVENKVGRGYIAREASIMRIA